VRKTAQVLKAKFNWVKYLKSPKNVGYGGGNNLGAKLAKGEYLFILNPDTKLQPKSLDTLASYLDKHPKVGIVAPNLIDESGKVYIQLGSKALTPLQGIVAHSFINKAFPNNPISRSYWLKDISMDELRDADAVPGSAFLIRKKVFEKVGGYDENIFLYFEETDLGKRVKEAGYKIFINPKAEVMHAWNFVRSEKLKKYSQESRFYYFKKRYGIFWALIVEAFARFSKKEAIYLGFLLLYILLALIILQL
jgi:GT2 family glycosyltransferase